MGVDGVRLANQRPLELPPCLLEIAACREHEAEIVVHLGSVWLELERAPIALFGRNQAALCQAHVTEIGLGIGGIRVDAERTLELGRGRIQFSLLQQDRAEVDVSLDQVRVDFERALKMDQRLVRAAVRHERIGKIVVRADEVRLERERALIGGDRFAQLAEFGLRIGKIVVRLGAWLEGDDPLVACRRFAVAAQLLEHVSEIGVGLDVVGLELDRLSIVTDRLAQSSERLQGESHVVVAVRHAIVAREGPADHIDCHLRLPLLQGNDAEVMQAAEMPAVACQHLPVDILGVEQLSGLMVAHGEREQRRDARGRRAGVFAVRTPVARIHLSAVGLTGSGADRRPRCRWSA